jgi:hypothetical protein
VKAKLKEARDLATLRSARLTVREAGVDGPLTPGGQSATFGRTVRDPRADSELNATEPPNTHLEMRTVRTLHTNCPRATRVARTVRDLWEDDLPNPSRPKTVGQTDRKESAQEPAKNTKYTWTNFTLRTVRLLPTDGPPGTGTAARA